MYNNIKVLTILEAHLVEDISTCSGVSAGALTPNLLVATST